MTYLVAYYVILPWMALKRSTIQVQYENRSTIQVQCDSSKYVTLCSNRLSGNHRLGNHLFMFAAMLFIADVTGREVAMPKDGWFLDKELDIDNIIRVDDRKDLCPCRRLPLSIYNYNPIFDNATEVSRLMTDSHCTLELCDLAQTYRYASAVELPLRKVLRFRPETVEKAILFMSSVQQRKPDGGGSDWFSVGVHVRRGDFLLKREADFGLTVVDKSYLRHAFEFFTSRNTRVQFIVATDDWKWTSTNIPTVDNAKARITHTGNNTAGVDLAILSMCDAIVVSTGSFGWWAAWLANKTTVYYENWPRPNSKLSSLQDKAGYFPRHWIPMT